MFVVQSGKLNVCITSSDSSCVSLKVVKAGESVASLLSFTDVLQVSDRKLREFEFKRSSFLFRDIPALIGRFLLKR